MSVNENTIDPSDWNSACPAEELFQKMATRRSIRSFSSEPVDKRILINAIRTAGVAPSGANRQPWFFGLITSQTIKDKIRMAAEEVEHEFYTMKASSDWLSDLKPLGTNSSKGYLSEAPALIAVFSQLTNELPSGELQKTYYPLESTGIAVGFLLTALHSAGLATLTHTPKPMLFLNEILGLKKTFRPFMIVVAGHPKQPIQVPQLGRKRLDEIMGEY